MRLADFDFELPDDRIADRPANPRDHARLLQVGSDGALTDRHVYDLPDILRPGDLLVFNDTKVIPSRLYGIRAPRPGTTQTGAKVECLLHKSIGPSEWQAFAKPAKRLAQGDRVTFGEGFWAEVLTHPDAGEVALRFNLADEALSQALERHGHIPLPPYILAKRSDDDRDRQDYQTVYARHKGSVAAPTAGLHFTDALLERLQTRGVECATLTLHVGAGTFLPVKVEDIAQHKMHAEWGQVTFDAAQRINHARARGGRVIAVGTTSLRLLESAAHDDGTLAPFAGETAIFITPGYRFKIVDGLMTNFHLPKSTLFMLISAFAGLACAHRAYAHAIAHHYRFYSYGDSSLWFRP